MDRISSVKLQCQRLAIFRNQDQRYRISVFDKAKEWSFQVL